MAIADLPQHYDAHTAEKKWQEYWEKEGIYKFNPASKGKGRIYSVDTPPPTVSGKMHMGHAFSYTHQDIIVRYHRMKGENIFYPFGFDDNGLATERFVEKRTGKRATEMPRAEFAKICLRETKDAEKELKDDFSSIGLSCDWNLVYRTVDKFSIKTSQRSFIDIYNKGRAYQKEAPTIWCPECATAIAQVELEDKELESHFNDIYFELENKEKIVIATTRPEFLPACVAIFVHPEDKRNKHLIGKKAKVPIFGQEAKIIADERVDMEKGTGIVMCCTFGDQTDMEWWKAYKLPLKVAITANGKMSELAGKYAGMPIKEARQKIIEELKQKGLLISQKKIKHTVNVHERCGTEIEFLVTKQWFIKYLDLKKEFLEAGRKLNWHPEHMRSRYEGWINGLQWDWCISRQRYFGVPFPVWHCKKCGKVILPEDKELPTDPLQDTPKKPCTCGSKEFEPEKDVMDTWATSSLTPQINLKWKDDEKFFKKMFPMSLRPQAHDIISFWLFNTVAKAAIHEKNVPWHNVMISGWALDEHGKKMSKSKGNTIEPRIMLEKYSADALRFWASSSKLGEDLNFSEKEFVNGTKNITKLWNASKFAITHLEDYDGKKAKLETVDKWALTKMHKLIKECTESFENYEYIRTRLDTEKFFWQIVCDNYLEIAKDRLYSQKGETRKAAQHTLYQLTLNTLKLFAPIMPHITEEIYHLHFAQKEKNKSIHLASWPEYDKKMIDEEAEKAGDLAVQIIGKIRKYKSTKQQSMKTEINKATIKCTKEQKKLTETVTDAIKTTMKVKEIEFNEGKELAVEIQ